MISAHSRTGALLVFTILLACLTGVQAAQAAAVLTVDNPRKMFGEIWEGETVEHTFLITNKGDEDLIISHVRTS